MRILRVAVVGLCVGVIAALPWITEIQNLDYYHERTDQLLHNGRRVVNMVMYFHPSLCISCRTKMKEYQLVAKHFSEVGGEEVMISSFNCEMFSAECHRHHVERFPFFILWSGLRNHRRVYTGDIESDDLIEFVKDNWKAARSHWKAVDQAKELAEDSHQSDKPMTAEL